MKVTEQRQKTTDINDLCVFYCFILACSKYYYFKSQNTENIEFNTAFV